MRIKVAWIGKSRDAAFQSLTDEYLKRIRRYADIEGVALKDERALLQLASGRPGSGASRCALVLMDARGKALSSEEFAGFLRQHQERNPLPLLLAIGPADGFGEETRKASASVLSMGKMTMAHELARVVLLEQIYRAFTILQGHPYHLGH